MVESGSKYSNAELIEFRSELIEFLVKKGLFPDLQENIERKYHFHGQEIYSQWKPDGGFDSDIGATGNLVSTKMGNLEKVGLILSIQLDLNPPTPSVLLVSHDIKIWLRLHTFYPKDAKDRMRLSAPTSKHVEIEIFSLRIFD